MPARLLVVLSILTAAVSPAGGAEAQVRPQAVVALIDTGINPYHETFRDPSATAHPSTYIDGYPADAKPLNLTLDAPTFDDALAADAEIWASVERQTLYYVPGTRIVGMYTLNGDGAQLLLDEHGHGTMTASRAAAGSHSLGAGARIVAFEGLGTNGVRWVASQPWIDVQSNSWGSLAPYPVSFGIYDAFNTAAKTQLVFAASGNGTGGFFGGGPNPTYLNATGAPGVVVVGAHDNGRVSAYSGSPAHVVADGFAGWTATRNSLDRFEPNSIACCTSASSPYAAGGAVRIVLEARRILGDTGTGVRDGVIASGPAGLVASGPLADGALTLAEAKEILLRTAEARPDEGADDGRLLWSGEPRSPEGIDRGQLADNPYCQACFTAPVKWTDVPDEFPAFAVIGYGAVNERSMSLATAVLEGRTELPVRTAEDLFFTADQTVRAATVVRQP